MSAYKDGWKKAQRDAAKENGYFDGRFAPKVVSDKYHNRDKYLCRELVEVPVEEEEVDEVVVAEETSASWKEDVSFNPFAAILRS